MNAMVMGLRYAAAVVGVSAGLGLSLGACSPGLPFGERCSEPSECASNLCTDDGYCSAACTDDVDCASAPSSETRFVCSEGQCERACWPGETRGTGSDLRVCGDGGHFEDCTTAGAANACALCGCAPFGGGNCVDGEGCFMPMPDGSPCERDEGCSSGICYWNTRVCGAPRAMGEPCSVDAECESLNCSTDGNSSARGHCNQVLGTSCGSSARETYTDTCTSCRYTFGQTYGVCFRTACDPVTANHCQSLDGHDFECARSTDGYYYCFERCAFAGDRCWFDTDYCYEAGDFCR